MTQQVPHEDVVGAGASEHEEVPDLVVAKHAGQWIRSFQGVHDRADRVGEAAGDQPRDGNELELREHQVRRHDEEPAHAEVDAGADPARQIQRDGFQHDAKERDGSNGREHGDAPDAVEQVQDGWHVRAGDHQEDRNMVELVQAQVPAFAEVEKVEQARREEHADETERVDGHRDRLGRSERCGSQGKDDSTDDGGEKAGEVGRCADRIFENAKSNLNRHAQLQSGTGGHFESTIPSRVHGFPAKCEWVD